MGKLVNQLRLDATGPIFTEPPFHILILMSALSNVCFFKVSPGSPMSRHEPIVHELLLTPSNYQKL